MTTENKKNISYAILVGRNGKIATSTFQIRTANGGNAVKYNGVSGEIAFEGQNYMAAMYNHAAKLVSDVAKSSKKYTNLILCTIDDMDIKTKWYFKQLKTNNGTIDVNELQRIINANQFQTAEVKEEIFKAVVGYFNAIEAANKAGITISSKKVSMLNRIELSVPEGVELQEGDKLDFKNGKASNGVTVQGWNTFARKGAVIHVEQRMSGRYYTLARKTSKTSRTVSANDILIAAAGEAWKKCPAAEPTKDVSVAENGGAMVA